jgi:hypothetical protein
VCIEANSSSRSHTTAEGVVEANIIVKAITPGGVTVAVVGGTTTNTGNGRDTTIATVVIEAAAVAVVKEVDSITELALISTEGPCRSNRRWINRQQRCSTQQRRLRQATHQSR